MSISPRKLSVSKTGQLFSEIGADSEIKNQLPVNFSSHIEESHEDLNINNIVQMF